MFATTYHLTQTYRKIERLLVSYTMESSVVDGASINRGDALRQCPEEIAQANHSFTAAPVPAPAPTSTASTSSIPSIYSPKDVTLSLSLNIPISNVRSPPLNHNESKENIPPYKQSPNNKRYKMLYIPRHSSQLNRLGLLIGRLSTIESDQSQRLFKLNLSIDHQRDEIKKLSTTIMTLQTQKSSQEFEFFKQQDILITLKQQLLTLENEVTELQSHEKLSLNEIEQKFELQLRSLHLNHEKKLKNFKINISKQIELAIMENVKKNEELVVKLTEEIEDIQKNIKSQEQDLNRKLIKMKEDHSMKLIRLNQLMDESLKDLQQEISNLDSVQKKYEDERSTVVREIGDFDEKISLLSSKLSGLQTKYALQEQELKSLEETVANLESCIHVREASFSQQELEIQHFQQQEIKYREQFGDQELVRRKLHNKLQELKGNIRVFCRIRPSLNSESESTTCFDISDNITVDGKTELKISRNKDDDTISSKAGFSPSKKLSYKFQFDHVIPASSTNLEIFTELSQLIQSSLDGFNVCVFAYGQTGSGKTWTMSNPVDGMIPLSIDKIFQDIEELRQHGWEYQVEGQFIEIYNETILDLLGSSSGKKHEIKHDDINNTTTVTNVNTVTLTSTQQVHQILSKASKNRSTAATKSNERSSRSHSIFIIKIKGTNSQKGIHCSGTLNLIDLAGSERISNSQVTGDRLKETQAINKSLSCLGDVIYALGNGQGQVQGHIPYRNSKLTYLLKNSLGGNSKSLMFVNVSPVLKNFNETLNSLRFATKVNNTKLITNN